MAFNALKHTLQSFDLFYIPELLQIQLHLGNISLMYFSKLLILSFIEKIVINLLVQEMRIMNSTYLPMCSSLYLSN